LLEGGFSLVFLVFLRDVYSRKGEGLSEMAVTFKEGIKNPR
jgi:hypothetical protein